MSLATYFPSVHWFVWNTSTREHHATCGSLRSGVSCVWRSWFVLYYGIVIMTSHATSFLWSSGLLASHILNISHSSDEDAMKNEMSTIAQRGNVICSRSDIRHVDISIRCHATVYKIYINGNKDRPSARFSALFSRDVSFSLVALANLARPQKWGKNERPMRYHFHLKVKNNFIWFDFEFFMNESGNAEGNRNRRYRNTTTMRLRWRCWWVSILRTSGLLYFRCKVSIIIIETWIGLFIIR